MLSLDGSALNTNVPVRSTTLHRNGVVRMQEGTAERKMKLFTSIPRCNYWDLLIMIESYSLLFCCPLTDANHFGIDLKTIFFETENYISKHMRIWNRINRLFCCSIAGIATNQNNETQTEFDMHDEQNNRAKPIDSQTIFLLFQMNIDVFASAQNSIDIGCKAFEC